MTLKKRVRQGNMGKNDALEYLYKIAYDHTIRCGSGFQLDLVNKAYEALKECVNGSTEQCD